MNGDTHNSLNKKNAVLGVIIVIVTVLLLIYFGKNTRGIYLHPMTLKSASETLLALFILSALIERAQEVYVSVWFSNKKDHLQHHLNENQNDEIAKKEYDEFQVMIQRYAFLSGVIIAFFISIAGLRVLAPLIDKNTSDLGTMQNDFFNFIDIVLTSAVLAGGSDGIHKLVSLVTDFFDITRKKINIR